MQKNKEVQKSKKSANEKKLIKQLEERSNQIVKEDQSLNSSNNKKRIFTYRAR
jgi:hypothetical protein